jgi:hypothetical protein
VNSISDFRQFFGRYQQFEQTAHDAFVHFLDRVRPELPPLMEAIRQEEMEFAPRFNVFRALGMERKEDDLHTPILAHLLNPSAQHAQGAIFLNHFFDVVRSYDPGMPDAMSLQNGHWAIRPEFPIGRGIVDLLLENARQKYIILIENKIDTDDHDDQIPRYHDWLYANRRHYRWRQLIYLTPDGREPLSCSGCKYLALSYTKDIVGFLAAALPEVRAHAVTEVVRQYLALLKSWMEDDDDKAG